MRRGMVMVGLVAAFMMGPPMPRAHADYDLVGAVGDVVTGVVALPMDVISGTLNGPPIIGTVGGVLRGALRTVGFTTRGLLRLAGIAVPVATSLAPFLPLFL